MIDNEERKYVLGGSECAIAADLHPKVTRKELMDRKILGLEQEQNWLMYWGKAAEVPVLNVIEHAPHFLVPPQNWVPKNVLGELPTVRHRGLSWACATVDGILETEDGRRILLEVKTSPIKRDEGWGPAGSDLVPTHYACQVLWNTAILLSQGKKVDESWIVALFGTREPQVFPIPYDAGKAEWLLEKGQEFMNELELRRKEAA